MPEKVTRYVVGQDKYDVPESDEKGFLHDFPDAVKETSNEVKKKDSTTSVSDGSEKPTTTAQESKTVTDENQLPLGYKTLDDAIVAHQKKEPLKKEPVKLPDAELPTEQTDATNVDKKVNRPDPLNILNKGKEVKTVADFNEKYGTDHTVQEMVDGTNSWRHPKDHPKAVQEEKDANIVKEGVESTIYGLDVAAQAVLQMPNMLYNTFAIPQNLVAEQTGLNIGTNADKALGGHNPLTKAAEIYAQHAENTLAEQRTKYDKTIIDEFVDGDKGKAIHQLSNAIIQMLPPMMAMAAAGAAGAPNAVVETGAALGFGGQKYQEISKLDLPESAKTANALGTGMLMSMFNKWQLEKMTIPVAKALEEKGVEAAGVVAKETFKQTYKSVFNKLVPAAKHIVSSLAFPATVFSTNILDKITGVAPDKDLSEGLGDALIMGMALHGGSEAGARLFNRERKDKIAQLKTETDQLKKDADNPDVQPQAKDAILESYQNKTEELNNEIEKDNTESQKYSDDEKKAVVDLSTKEEQNKVVISDPSVSNETKTLKVAENEKLNNEIDKINKEVEARKLKEFQGSQFIKETGLEPGLYTQEKVDEAKKIKQAEIDKTKVEGTTIPTEPKAEGDKSVLDSENYRGQHKIKEPKFTADKITEAGGYEDFFENPSVNVDLSEPSYKESYRALKQIKANPDEEVTVYRAVPKGIDKINDGDWISLSKTYAKEHGMHETDESKDLPVISMKVKAKDIGWDGNDINEFSYNPKNISATPQDINTSENGNNKGKIETETQRGQRKDVLKNAPDQNQPEGGNSPSVDNVSADVLKRLEQLKSDEPKQEETKTDEVKSEEKVTPKEKVKKVLKPKSMVAKQAESVIEDKKSTPIEKKEAIARYDKEVEKEVKDKFTDWHKNLLGNIDKAIKVAIDSGLNKDLPQEELDKTYTNENGIREYALRNTEAIIPALRKEGFTVTDKGQVTFETPNGEMKINIEQLPEIRKEVVKLATVKKEVSNENTRITGHGGKTEFEHALYEPSTQEEAIEEHKYAKDTYDNAVRDGNKKLIEIAKKQFDFYANYDKNFDKIQEDNAAWNLNYAKQQEEYVKEKMIANNEGLQSMFNDYKSVFSEQYGIHSASSLYDILHELGFETMPDSFNNKVSAVLTAKNIAESGLTYDEYVKKVKSDLKTTLDDQKQKFGRKSGEGYVKPTTINKQWDFKRNTAAIEKAEYELSQLEKHKKDIQSALEGKPTKSVSQRLIDALESAKIRTKEKAYGIIPPFNIIPAVWNTSINIIQTAIKAGVSIHDAIQQGLKYLKSQIKDLDEDAYLSHMKKQLGVETEQEVSDKVKSENIADLESKKEKAKTSTRKEFYQSKIDELKGEGAPQKKERRLTKQMIKDSSLSDEFKSSIGEDEIHYDELPNKVTVAEANAIINYLGDENAAKELKNQNNGMKIAVRNTIAQILVKRYEAQGDYDSAIDLREDLVKSATEQGQGIQTFAMFPSLTPEGEVRVAQKLINKDRAAKEKKAKPTTDKLKKGLRNINEETAKEVVKNLSDKIDEKSKITVSEKSRTAEYGSKNKIVTKQAYLEARKALKGKLFAAVIPPELITIGTYHIEAGSRKFAEFSEALIDDLGNKVKPYLKDLYNKIRENPELKDLSTDEEIAAHEQIKSGEVWKEKLEKAIATKNKKESDKAIANLQQIAKDEGLWGKYRDMAAKRLKLITPEQIKEDISGSAPLEDFTDGLVKNMQAKIDESLPEIEKGTNPQRKSIEVIADAYKNIEKYQDVWDKSFADFVKKNKDNPEVLEQMDAYFGDILATPFSEKLVGKSVKEGLKDMNVNIADVVVKHYTVYDHTKTSLVDKLITESGLSGAEAKELATQIGNEFDKIATAKKKQLLEKVFATKEHRKVESKSLEDEVIKLTNLGAFKEDELVRLYGDKMGFPKLTVEQVKNIEKLAELVQEAPDGFKKFKAIEDLLAYQANIPGVSKTDIALSIWYANLLSGFSTQLVNTVGNTANSTALFASMVAQNPTAAKFIASGFVDGLRRGVLEGISTWNTGYSPIRGKVEIPATLERVEFWGKNLNPANYLKYVRRVMVAADVVLFEAQKEMRAYQMAWKEAAMADKLEPTLSMKDKALQIMNKTDEVFNNAKADAQLEFDTEKEKINSSSKSASEKEKLIKDAEFDRHRRIYELIEKERSGDILEESASFAARGTYNYKPEGALGVMANVINQATSKIPALKLIVPFTNIIANVANEAINYTPLGFARNLPEINVGGKTIMKERNGSISGNREKPMTDQEKIDLTTKAVMGTSLMVAAYVLSGGGDDKKNHPIQITGGGTGDYRKNYELQETGWQPYSIKFGNTWVSYQYTPLMLGLGFIGQIRDYETYREGKMSDNGFLTKVSAAAGYTSKSLFDMTFLSSLNTTLSALMDPRNENRLEDLLTQFKGTGKAFVVPALYTQTARELEKWFEIPTKEVRNTYLGDLLKDVPVARNGYADKINGLGEPVIPDTDRIVSFSKENKLWQLIADKKAFITVPSINTLKIYDGATGIERFLSQDEYYKFCKDRGTMIKQYLDANYKALDEMPDWKAKENISKAEEQATLLAKVHLGQLHTKESLSAPTGIHQYNEYLKHK